jgi:NAD dependent epimerase/dehydratase family enzyme
MGRSAPWIAVAEYKPAKMLSASAAGYYGRQQPGDDAVLTKSDCPQPTFMSDLCPSGSKPRMAQLPMALAWHACASGWSMMLLPIKLGLGGPLGGGAQWLSWIHVDDVIGGIATFAAWVKRGICNFTAPECLYQAQFSRVAAAVLRRPYGFPTPGLPIRMALGEQTGLLLKGQRVAPGRLKEGGFVFRYPRLDGALRSIIRRCSFAAWIQFGL